MLTRQDASRRPLMVIAAITVTLTLLLLPVSRTVLGPAHSFLPAMLAVVACFDIISVYLLVGDYRDRGDLRLLLMALAYCWSLVVMLGYGLAFPGALVTAPPLGSVPSVAPYLYLLWHGGFPVLLGLAWAPWPARWIRCTAAGRRRTAAVGSLAGATAAGIVVVLAVVSQIQALPVLIVGTDTSGMTRVTAPLVMPLVLLALASAAHGTWRRTGPERWVTIAIAVCLCDLALTYYSRTRFSVGWYTGRTMTLASSGMVLLAMITGFRRLKAQAEHDAAIDALTGLPNRRSVFVTLDQLVARCTRSGAPLGVLSLDLDLFKQVNDLYGHQTGDAVLAETGRLLTWACRHGDVVARVGGEEFLVLLPDTDTAGILVVAEKMRVAISLLTVPGLRHTVSVSIGATQLGAQEHGTGAVLHRADMGLYAAKAGGRNQVLWLDADAQTQADAQPLPPGTVLSVTTKTR